MVSVEGLTKLVDPSQLTSDLEGTLEYNHVEWTELRVSLEEFTGGALHLLSRLEELQEALSRQELAANAEEARKLLEEHGRLRKTMTKAPVDELDHEGQRLLQKIRDGGTGGFRVGRTSRVWCLRSSPCWINFRLRGSICYRAGTTANSSWTSAFSYGFTSRMLRR